MDLQEIDCYWHTLQKVDKGLTYCGISLIPPKSLETFINVLFSQNKQEYTHLIELAILAKKNNKYTIHYRI